ncbi:type II secretion system minor pseudopilin GspI [Marinomonas sp. PE14-40]|uniref:type II secretion system minor pseudopilin GspI n=1 Tax=Marinomonas sp. PE14-40 TaxID=3060621 RepID=UPI003F668562
MPLNLAKTKAGFTLMEVLVALVILAFVSLVLVQVTSQSTSQADYLKRKMLAVWIAQDRLTYLKLLSISGQELELGDQEVEQANLSWSSEALVTKTANGVITIEVAIFQPPSAENSIYRMTGFVAARTEDDG